MTLLTPEFLQTKKYTAKRDRAAMSHSGAIQAGVWDGTDFKVSQRAEGANMSADVALGYALVPANHAGNRGFYHVENDAKVNVTTVFGGGAWTSHGSLPRIDQLILIVRDTIDGGGAADAASLEVLTGTATSGATLANRNGAATLPSGALRLADILIPAGATTVTTANIRDRRPWARGYNEAFQMTATGTTSSALPGVQLSSSNVRRFESSGGVFEIIINCTVRQSQAGRDVGLAIMIDGANARNASNTAAAANENTNLTLTHYATIAAGSHTFDLNVYSDGSGTASVPGPGPISIRELVLPSANNGTS